MEIGKSSRTRESIRPGWKNKKQTLQEKLADLKNKPAQIDEKEIKRRMSVVDINKIRNNEWKHQEEDIIEEEPEDSGEDDSPLPEIQEAPPLPAIQEPLPEIDNKEPVRETVTGLRNITRPRFRLCAI